MQNNFELSAEAIEKFLMQQRPKPGRKVIWNSYSLGTYNKTKHGPIGTPKHSLTTVSRVNARLIA